LRDVADQFLKWEYQAGVKLGGLVTRREAERALFLKA
jgi:GH24 family phage-related lysozyme (muramidase)